MKEIWKNIESYEGLYQVSNLGRVKSLKYNKQRILKTPSDAYGYSVCNLSSKGKQKIFKVHKLVAMAFLNHTPNGHNTVVDHINNLKIDNRLENLQITSQRENTSKDKKKGSSKYVGVYWKKNCNKWVSKIWINGKSKHLGRFTDEMEAAKSYQNALKSLS